MLILLGLGYSFLWPRTFEAIARIKIEKDHTEIHSRGHGFDPYWVQTEFEMIQAKVVLYPVITNLNLTSKWARSAGRTNDLSVEYVYVMLKRKLLIRQSRNTAVIEICAFSNDPGEAAELANVIATTFRGKKLEDRRKMHAAFSVVNSPVQIIDLATVPTKAIRPIRGIVLLLVGGGAALVVVLGLALFDLAQKWSERAVKSLR